MFVIDIPIFVLHSISISRTFLPTIFLHLVFSSKSSNPTYSQEKNPIVVVKNRQQYFNESFHITPPREFAFLDVFLNKEFKLEFLIVKISDYLFSKTGEKLSGIFFCFICIHPWHLGCTGSEPLPTGYNIRCVTR